MKVSLPKNVGHDLGGFAALADLWAHTANCTFTQIELDLGAVVWLDADMCAPFGALLHALGQRINTIQLLNLRPDVERALAQSGFLSFYGGKTAPDRWGTTLPYQRFDPKDDRYFADYVTNKVLHHSELPVMSNGLVKKLSESLFELFNNAVLHSQTRLGIFCCGQFFPKRSQLNFSIADLGIGIRRNVVEKTGLTLDAAEAIVWATTGRNTTRRGAIPGGLGLKLLMQFVALNGGHVQIVSDAGYWRWHGGKGSAVMLDQPFPGTVVNVEINTADDQSYMLTSEAQDRHIF